MSKQLKMVMIGLVILVIIVGGLVNHYKRVEAGVKETPYAQEVCKAPQGSIKVYTYLFEGHRIYFTNSGSITVK